MTSTLIPTLSTHPDIHFLAHGQTQTGVCSILLICLIVVIYLPASLDEERAKEGGMMELPKLGVLGFFDTLRGRDIGPFAQKVEQLGYGALWVPEIMGREIFSLSTYILSQTERISGGTGVAIAYSYEPIAAMSAARAVSELFDNRFILGLGVSNKAYNTRRGIDYGKPVTFLRDYIAKMKAAPYHAPKPQHEPPIVLAAMMPKMLQLAAAETQGTLTYFTTTEQVAGYRRSLGPQPWLGVVQLVMLETNPMQARTSARRYMQIYMAIEHYLYRLRALGFDEEDFTNGGSDRLVDAIVAWGSETQIRDRLAAQYNAGANHVCIVPLRSDGAAGTDERGLQALAPSQ